MKDAGKLKDPGKFDGPAITGLGVSVPVWVRGCDGGGGGGLGSKNESNDKGISNDEGVGEEEKIRDHMVVVMVAVLLKHPEDTYYFTHNPEFPGPLLQTIEIVSSRIHAHQSSLTPQVQQKEETPAALPLGSLSTAKKHVRVIDLNNDSPIESESDPLSPAKCSNISDAQAESASTGTSNKENTITKPIYKYEKPVAKGACRLKVLFYTIMIRVSIIVSITLSILASRRRYSKPRPLHAEELILLFMAWNHSYDREDILNLDCQNGLGRLTDIKNTL
ncbi:hypothetical protein V8E55_008654 [Tylopilus felleus]